MLHGVPPPSTEYIRVALSSARPAQTTHVDFVTFEMCVQTVRLFYCTI
ncbi:hypothetical protein TSMEX_001253 [Taenia solium]|eukprot:TsM_000280800 transcript=TsM_000280800 gene=TsM_000280800